MGTCARNPMVWDRFIADQRSCGLRHHLDSVPPDTPIQEIVDRCRVWESHSEQKRGHPQELMWTRDIRGCPVTPGSHTLFREISLRTVGCPEVESRIPVPVASVVQSDIVGSREAGSGCNQDVPPGIMPSLIAGTESVSR